MVKALIIGACILYLAIVLKENGFKIDVTNNKFISLAREEENHKPIKIPILLVTIIIIIVIFTGNKKINLQQLNIGNDIPNSDMDISSNCSGFIIK